MSIQKGGWKQWRRQREIRDSWWNICLIMRQADRRAEREEGRKEGITQGLEEGMVRGIVQTIKSLKGTMEQAAEQLSLQCGMSQDEAAAAVRKYC